MGREIEVLEAAGGGGDCVSMIGPPNAESAKDAETRGDGKGRMSGPGFLGLSAEHGVLSGLGVGSSARIRPSFAAWRFGEK